jgi:hypothetical protein
VSFLGSLGVTISLGEQHIVLALENNPQSYSYFIQNTFLFLILPSAVGLAVSIIAFVKEIKHPTGIFNKFWLPLAVFGGLFFFWEACMLWWLHNDYLLATHYMEYYIVVHHGVDIRAPLQTVYTMVKIAYVLWLIAGILYMLSPILKVMLKKVSPQQNSSASSAEKTFQHATLAEDGNVDEKHKR